jgi:steroid delta-isomerase-like uncharacterized protein
MSTDNLKALARQFYAAIDADQASTMPAVLSPDLKVYQPGMPPLDRVAFQQFGQVFYAAFPDLHHHIEDQVAEGDTVVNRLVIRGTHQGAFQGIPPTNKAVTLTAIAIQRYADGQMVEQHMVFDALGLMQQLGVVPAPEQAPA